MKQLFLCLLAAGALRANAINYYVDCEAFPAPAVISGTSCSVQGFGGTGGSSTSPSMSVTLIGNTLHFFGQIDSLASQGSPDPASGVPYGARTFASASINLLLSTYGLTRPGIMIINGSQTGSTTGFGQASEFFTITDSSTGNNFSCASPSCVSATNKALAMTLGGQKLTLLVEQTADANTTVGGQGSAHSYLDFSIQFFEQNGFTPVNISVSPEPGTWALIAVAGSLLTIVRRRVV